MEFQETPEIEANYIETNKDEDKKINNKNEDSIQSLQSEIICPECKENCFIKIRDYKINFFGCKNGHNINNILFRNYANTQVSRETKLCENCKKNKNDKDIYKCLSCKIDMCKNCKLNHKHKTMNYEQLKYICIEHNENFTKYCEECNKIYA